MTNWEENPVESQNETSYYIFTVEYLRNDQVSYTKRSYLEFSLLLQNIQKQNKTIKFPSLSKQQLSLDKSLEQLTEILNKLDDLLKFIVTQKIYDYNFYNFLAPNETLKQFNPNIQTFSQNLQTAQGTMYSLKDIPLPNQDTITLQIQNDMDMPNENGECQKSSLIFDRGMSFGQENKSIILVEKYLQQSQRK